MVQTESKRLNSNFCYNNQFKGSSHLEQEVNSQIAEGTVAVCEHKVSDLQRASLIYQTISYLAKLEISSSGFLKISDWPENGNR